MLKRESRNTTNIMKRTKWKRYVYVRDVQGNIRAVVGENNAVAEQTDYYPYGMPMADVNSASAQPFKFGGKELEREGGMDFYDFEARRLDFALGRFTSPDPLCEQTPEISPYAYCAADPVNFIDPTGMQWRATKNEKTGKYTGYEWVDPSESYDSGGKLLPGLYEQAIFFSNQGENGSHDPNVKYNMGTSTAFVYEKDGGISKFEACTYPSDSKNFATVPEGIYEAQKGLHKNAYPALRLSDVGTENFSDNTIELGAPNPSNPSVTVAKYINIHKAGINNCTGDAKTIISAGCLLIDVNNWDQFIDKFDYDATISVTVSRSISIPTDKNIIKRQDVPSIKVTLPTDVLRVVQPLFINNK